MNAGRTLLVATDGSAHSHRVLPHAALLADALGVRLTLMTVLDGPPDAGRAELESTLARFGIDGDVRVQALQPKEKTAAAILRAAKELDAVFLALDSRGHGALLQVLHGSVAVELLREADLPMLVSGPNLEPPPARRTPYTIVATNDGSASANAVLQRMAPLMTAASFQVALLRVHEREPGGKDNEAALEACRRELASARALLPAELEVETLVREIPRGGGVDTAIIEKSLEMQAHAIAMSTQGHNARRNIVLGSLALTMLGRSRLPLILTRAEVEA